MDILATDGMELIALDTFVGHVSFNPHVFCAFEIRGIVHRFSLEVCEVAPELERLYEAQSVKLRIKANANRMHWRDKAENCWPWISKIKTPFEGLCVSALVERIVIRYRDGSEKEISVPWKSFDIEGKSWLREHNMLYKAWIDKQGCLNISIDESNREEMRRKLMLDEPVLTTEDAADMREVLHDYSDFDFTKVPLLYSEEQFEAYSAAFMEKYGNNACIRDEMEEEGITEQELKRDKMVDDQNVYMILEVYNSVRCMMGHEILGFKEEDDWEDY